MQGNYRQEHASIQVKLNTHTWKLQQVYCGDIGYSDRRTGCLTTLPERIVICFLQGEFTISLFLNLNFDIIILANRATFVIVSLLVKRFFNIIVCGSLSKPTGMYLSRWALKKSQKINNGIHLQLHWKSKAGRLCLLKYMYHGNAASLLVDDVCES